MADSGKTPKFIWVVVGLILLAVVAYAILSGQPIENIKMPGGEVKFGAKPKDQRFSFIVSQDIGTGTVQSETVIYIDGNKAASLYADANRRGVTAKITVPRPGQYSYRLEQTGIHLVVYEPDFSQKHPAKFTYTGEGRININPGDGFKIGTIMYSSGARKLELWPILTKE